MRDKLNYCHVFDTFLRGGGESCGILQGAVFWEVVRWRLVILLSLWKGGGETKVILVSREIFCGGERVGLRMYREGGVEILGGVIDLRFIIVY